MDQKREYSVFKEYWLQKTEVQCHVIRIPCPDNSCNDFNRQIKKEYNKEKLSGFIFLSEFTTLSLMLVESGHLTYTFKLYKSICDFFVCSNAMKLPYMY